jgi:hypothetical protein
MAASAIALGIRGPAGDDHRLVRAPGPLSALTTARLRAARQRVGEPARPRPRRARGPRRSPGMLVRVNGHWYPAGGSFDQDAVDRPGDKSGPA